MKRIFVLLALVVILAIPATNVKAASKITTLTLKNGAVYTGEVRNGRPNGNGSMTRADSSINY
ncbi:hypothetical protein [Paenibacillus sp. FSL L8-0709]|uniref:hypothetical protein n=1 Tax=Paenibacillus sp. FSL L8-0709 TaxID=2975312 RepID=UPI0030F680BA